MFADLGFDQEEAETLKAESQRIIAEKLAIKERRTSASKEGMASCLKKKDALKS